MDRWFSGWLDGNVWADRRTDGQMDGWITESMQGGGKRRPGIPSQAAIDSAPGPGHHLRNTPGRARVQARQRRTAAAAPVSRGKFNPF